MTRSSTPDGSLEFRGAEAALKVDRGGRTSWPVKIAGRLARRIVKSIGRHIPEPIRGRRRNIVRRSRVAGMSLEERVNAGVAERPAYAFRLYYGALTAKRLGYSRILRSFICLIEIAVLAAPHIPLHWLYLKLWPVGLWPFWLGAAITVAGLLFAVWAREYLGRNWSSAVTIKRGHELITAGPYTVVRHPIYTGILTGFLGMAIATSQVRGFITPVLFLLAFWIKLRREEEWMRSKFGEAYVTYTHRTAALVPYLL